MSILRKTRFKSLLDGDMKKHGFFMIAEMLLIMIGINGALQIDNWNENINEELLTPLNEIRGLIDNELSKSEI